MRDFGVHVRAAVAADLLLIQRMLYEAANRPGEDWPVFEASIQEPRNLRFWRDWMRPGDLGVVAERGEVPIGAAWMRKFSGEEVGPWDDPEIPVLAIGVERSSRGEGVGRALMNALIGAAMTQGVPAIDLTTGTFNEVAMHLYHSSGFEDVAQQGDALRMRLALARAH